MTVKIKEKLLGKQEITKKNPHQFESENLILLILKCLNQINTISLLLLLSTLLPYSYQLRYKLLHCCDDVHNKSAAHAYVIVLSIHVIHKVNLVLKYQHNLLGVNKKTCCIKFAIVHN